MLKIQQSKKFKKDLHLYKLAIESIADNSVKQEYQTLLNKLVEQFKIIDAAHDTVNKGINPTKIRENVELSVRLRQKLDKLIKDSKDL